MICCDKALAKLGIKKEGCRVVVQGFGNVGSLAAQLMQKAGYKIVGLADIGGGFYNENGFDVSKVIDWVYTQKKSLSGFPRRRHENVRARHSLSTLRNRHPRRY